MRSLRFQRFILFSIVALSAAVAFNGCKTQIDDPAPGDFAQIRVMSFATGSHTFDIYIEQDGGALDTLPTAQTLGFGLAAVYRNNLPAVAAGTLYHVIIRPVNNKTTTLATANVTVHPGEKWTVVVYFDASHSTYPVDVIQDPNNGQGSGVTDKVFVRFLNTYSRFQKLNVRINDNLTGDPIVADPGIGYRQVTPYLTLPFKTDTSYTFFIIDPNGGDSVVGRIAGVSFDPGSYHTVTFSWDSTQLAPLNPADVAGNALDSLRVHVFDDNYVGNDVTSPLIPQTLRYNFINGYVPNQFADTTKKVRFYQQMGIVINNDGNITFPNMTPFSIAPSQVSTPWGNTPHMDKNGTQLINSVLFTCTQLTAAIDVKGFRTDGLPAGGRGTLQFDYRVGKRSDIVSDLPASLILADTCWPFSTALPDFNSIKEVAVPIPDNAIAGMARLVLVNGLAFSSSPKAEPAPYSATTFVINGVTDPNFKSRGPLSYDNKYPPITADGNTEVSITATIGKIPTTVNTSFAPSPGKIYEIVLVGQVTSLTPANLPHILIICTNPTTSSPFFKSVDSGFPPSRE